MFFEFDPAIPPFGVESFLLGLVGLLGLDLRFFRPLSVDESESLSLELLELELAVVRGENELVALLDTVRT
jgi:hypothetical protein